MRTFLTGNHEEKKIMGILEQDIQDVANLDVITEKRFKMSASLIIMIDIVGSSKALMSVSDQRQRTKRKNVIFLHSDILIAYF